MNLFAELKRRNVHRVAIAYMASTWLLIQVADIVLPRFGFSDVAVTNLILVLLIGFVPAVVLSWFFEFTSQGLRRESELAQVQPPAGGTGKLIDRIIVLVLVLAVGFFAFDKFVLDPARDTIEIEAAKEKGRSEAFLESYGDKSIAVMAFSDMSPGKDQEYFSDGIAEELLNLLATIRELRVISRSSAFSFKGSSETLQEIGKKLNVSYILEGSVRKAGDQIRITAQLIDARTDAHIWSQTYDRKLDDVFAIQDEISANIVDQLKLTLLSGLTKATKIDAQAYEKYLKARYIVHTESVAQLREAQALLNEILEIEPDYIPALNQLARVYYRIPKTEGMSPEQNTAEIEALANRVIAINPDGIDALIWQGWLAWVDGRYQDAADFYELGMAIDPVNVDLLRVVGVFLNTIGRTEEAIELGNFLLSRDPSCLVCMNNLASSYRLIGNYQQAILVTEQMGSWHAPTDGYYWSIGMYWLLDGKPENALASFQKELNEVSREVGWIIALYDLQRLDEFESRFSAFRETPGHDAGIAAVYAWIGDNDHAFEWLDKLIAEFGPRAVRWIDPNILSRLESDPRWLELPGQISSENQAADPIDFQLTLPSELSTH